MIPGRLARLVSAARRRMRLNRTLAAAGPVLVTAGAAWLLWTVGARLVLLPPVGALIAVGLGAAALAALAGAALVRIPPLWAAWAADRWLGTRELYSTAVELAQRGGQRGVALLQVQAADEAAAGFRGFPERPRVPTRMLGVGAVLLLAGTGLGLLPNPKDDLRALRAAQQEAVAEEAARLRAAADDVDGAGQESADLPERLEELAAELEQGGLDEALERLGAERAELERRLDRHVAAQRTALAGLARELDERPLAGGDSVRDQLEALADELDGAEADTDDLEGLAERLAALAGSLGAGPQGVRDGLAGAAGALRDGDPAGAADGLRSASQAVGQAQGHLDAQAAVERARSAVAAAEQRLRAAEQGQPGQGDGQGDGDGDGQGDGDGDGQGQGDGGAGGGGGGQPSGQVDDGGARQGAGSGRGSSQDGGGSPRADSDREQPTVYDPPGRVGGEGDDLHLPGSDEHDGAESAQGRDLGRGQRTGAVVPYREVLARYRDQAARVIERDGYPVRLRHTVQAYFDRL